MGGRRQGFIGRASQRENGGYKRLLGHRDAIDKIFASAIDGVVDGQDIIAVAGDLVIKNRVGVETEVVGEGDFAAISIGQLRVA